MSYGSCAMRKGSMLVYASDKDHGLYAMKDEAVENKRKHGKLVRKDATDKRRLRKECNIPSSNVVRLGTYKKYRSQRVTQLTDKERENEQVRLLVERGFIERRTLSRQAKRLLAQSVSVK